MFRFPLLFPGVVVLAALGACARAGEPALPSRFGLRAAWPDAAELTYSIEGPLQAHAPELERACASWSATGAAGFRAAAPEENPDFVVTWERGAHGPCTPFGTDPSVAHTGPLPGPTFIHLDSGRSWDTAGGPSLEQALLHELGHVLGLDHSPDTTALMYADPATREITRAERDALHTLYGGGTIDASDLVVTRDGRTLAVVHGVATPGCADFELFDTDGDGDDELVVWRIDAQGQGELTAFHFEAGPRPVRTVGPRLGMTAPGAAVELLTTASGERVLLLAYPNGNRIVRRFDDEGHLRTGADEGLPELDGPRVRRTTGDLDGDGVQERVSRGQP